MRKGENMVNLILGSGPLLLGALIAATELLKWPRKVHYLWAGIALTFGIVVMFM